MPITQTGSTCTRISCKQSDVKANCRIGMLQSQEKKARMPEHMLPSPVRMSSFCKLKPYIT
ncbi:hypothetical protein COS86_04175 [Candidatus Bathyarchaeota archaeon CG07_land_8_20_14_0_80_47_9]|nr:MAG: hypothetical protein COS86_04175 [Candidatus Bathyarchaeota archaeon CG07_land_8_20_14_0_80_47_9]